MTRHRAATALVLVLAGCQCALPPVDYTGKQCPTGECPTGFDCVAGVCRPAGEDGGGGGSGGGGGGSLHLAFATPARTAIAGACSAAVTLETRDATDAPTPLAAGAIIALSATPAAGFAFFSDAACSSSIAGAAIFPGASSATFYFRGVTVGAVAVSASASGLTNAVQAETVAPAGVVSLAFTTAAQTVAAGGCSAVATLELRDAAGNAAPASTAVAVALAANPAAGFTFFSDSACATATTSVSMAAGATQASFYFQGQTVGDVVVSASATALASATQTETVASGGPAKLAFVTTPQVLAIGVCGGATDVEVRDANDNPAPVAAATAVALTAAPSGGFAFFDDAACTNAVTSVTVAAASTTARFYMRGTAAGAVVVTAASAPLTQAQQTETVQTGTPVQLAFVTGTQTVTAGNCSGVATVESQDSSANPAAVSAATTVSLAAAPATGFTFYSDAACATSAVSVSLASGTSRANFYFKGTAAGAVLVTASAAALNPATQTETVNAGAATKLAYVSAPQTTALSQCSAAVTVEARDAFNNPAPNAAARTVNLAAVPSAGFTFSAAAGCGASVTSVTIPAAGAQATFYFKGTSAGSIAMTATSAGLTQDVQTATVVSGGPVSLVFSSAPQSVAANSCSGPLVIESRDSANAAAVVAGNTSVALAATPSTGFTFYAGTGCSGAAITSTTLLAATSSVTVSFRGTTAGTVSVTGTAIGLNQAQQNETLTAGAPTQIVFTTAAKVLAAGSCSTVATVETRDASGNVAGVTSATTLNLSANPSAGFAFYSDATCITAITTRALAIGQSTASFYMRGTAAGPVTVTVAGGALTPGVQSESVLAGTPNQLAFTTVARSAVAGVCSQILTVESRDAFGNVAAAPGATSVGLVAAPTTGFTFHTDAACGTAAVTTVSIPASGTTASFYFKGTVAGPVNLTASATGFNPATQGETITPAAAASFTWSTISTPQIQDISFSATVQAKDAFGNLATGFVGTAALTIAPAGTVACVASCTNASTTAAFSGGAWTGSISSGAPVGTGRQVTATAGAVTGTSVAFEVQPPPAAGGTPPQAKFTANPVAIVAGATINFDASASSDYETAAANLEVSWDFSGTNPAAPPWTAWTTTKTAQNVFAAPGVFAPRLAVKDTNGNIGYATLTVAVVAAAGDLCVVDTSSVARDGAASCAGPFGTDGKLSLIEAIAIANASGTKTTITFSGPMTISMPSGGSGNLSGTTDVLAPVGVVLQGRGINVASQGTALMAGLELASLSNDVSVIGTGKLTFVDGYVHDGVGFSIGGELTIERSRLVRCSVQCVLTSATTAASHITVRSSQLLDSAGTALSIGGCTAGSGTLDIQSSLFSRNSTAVSVGSGCAASRIVHNSFRANGTAVSYAGLAGHVLRNNVFTGQTTSAASCGSATFTNRDYHQLFQNASNGCLAADPNSLATDPLYILPASDDLRLQLTSPAKDSALDLGLDVNGPAPGNFTGPAPDRGGRETW